MNTIKTEAHKAAGLLTKPQASPLSKTTLGLGSVAKKSDLVFGNIKEVEELKRVQNKFSSSLKKVKDNYFVFDYSCKNCYVELKSRRNTHDKYPDTMVGKNKLDYAEKSDRPVYFCFSFTDGLYFWKYNKEDIENGNVEFRIGGRTDRGKQEYKDYAFIKTNILEKI